MDSAIASPFSALCQRSGSAELYAEADIFALASRYEGYGMAYAEAIAHGVPVVGTNAGAIPGTVPPDAGLLVAPDDVTAFASALRRLIGDADERRRFADAARSCGGAAPDLAGIREIIRTRAGGRDMTGFSADWLTLREPFDMRARNPSVLDAVAHYLAAYPSVRIVDLACGTGSTLRALSARLPSRQNWNLVDNDLSLLARATATALRRCRRHRNSARSQSRPRSGTRRTCRSCHHVRAARPGLRVLAGAADRGNCRAQDPVLCGIKLRGHDRTRPADPLDAAVIAAMNAHQRTDKGFGPALGPAAADAAIARFKSLGYSVKHGRSDWVISPQDQDMQNEILAGWAHAAREIDALTLADTAAWLTRRRDFVAAGRSSIRVGHVDVFACRSERAEPTNRSRTALRLRSDGHA